MPGSSELVGFGSFQNGKLVFRKATPAERKADKARQERATETETYSTGLVLGGTHYAADGDHEYVEVVGGPAPVERFADAVRMRRVVSHGRAIELQDGTLLLACDGDCVQAAIVGWLGWTVPDGTRARVDAWPCVGEECHGCAGGAK